MSNQITTKEYFAKDGVKKKFEELLGKKSTGFITSVMQVVNGNNYLQKASPESIFNAAAMAATLDLPINNNLGLAWIVPYGNQAQFQMGWKGFVQLAQRTGQYKSINVVEVYENQFNSYNRLTEELDADFTLTGDGSVVGYVAYFRLLNGFEKTSYWSIDEVKRHGVKFSKTYSQKGGVWESNFDAMAKKTVLKNTLSKWGLLSIEMQHAMQADQAIINDVETMDVEYVDAGTDKQAMLSEIDDESIDSLIAEGYTIEQITKQYSLNDSQLLKYA